VSEPLTAVNWDYDGKGVSLDYDEQDLSDQAWMTIETILVRIHTRYAASGRFPVHFCLDAGNHRRTVCANAAVQCSTEGIWGL